MVTIRQMQTRAWEIAKSKGFHDDICDMRTGLLLRLCLVHTEVSEAAQEVKRHGLTDNSRQRIGEELADTVIRLLDVAEIAGIDLESAVHRIMQQNEAWGYKYGTPDALEVSHGTTN